MENNLQADFKLYLTEKNYIFFPFEFFVASGIYRTSFQNPASSGDKECINNVKN